MLTFDEAAHEYKLDGHTLPSVTHICRYLSVDIDKSRPWLRDMAANRGTRVHAYCEIIDYDGPEGLRVEPDCIGYVQAYLAFRRDYRIKGWLAVERPIASASLGVAGTPDRIGYVDNVMTIVDLKPPIRRQRICSPPSLTAIGRSWQRLTQIIARRNRLRKC